MRVNRTNRGALLIICISIILSTIISYLCKINNIDNFNNMTDLELMLPISMISVLFIFGIGFICAIISDFK